MLEGLRQLGEALSVPSTGNLKYCGGDYRIICQILNRQLVNPAVQIRNRREIYR